MTKVSYKDWNFEVDKTITQNTYKNIKRASAEESETLDGLNFAKQRDDIYPEEIKQLFEKLGIDYKKEAEVSHFAAVENGMHLYSGWFHFKGNFTGPDYLELMTEDDKKFNLIEITKNFSLGFRKESFLTSFEDRKNLVQVEFECLIPWVLEQEYEDEDEIFDM